MTPSIRLHREAEEELAAAVAWYEARRPRLGAELLEAVDEALRLVEKRPELGARLPHSKSHQVRRILVSKFPYQVVYLPTVKPYAVVAAAHMKRRPGYWTGRL